MALQDFHFGMEAFGDADTPTGPYHTFVYSNGQMTDLGTLGGSISQGFGINDLGQITGLSTTPTPPGGGSRDIATHAFIYSNGQMTDLGTPPDYIWSFGIAINNAGHVAGRSQQGYMGAEHAFLYRDSQFHDLNDLIDPALGLTLYSAAGINDQGQIVANGYSQIGFPGRAFLLTPIPEPSTLALLGLAFSGLCVWSRRHTSVFR